MWDNWLDIFILVAWVRVVADNKEVYKAKKKNSCVSGSLPEKNRVGW